jgi:hypothetical protein
VTARMLPFPPIPRAEVVQELADGIVYVVFFVIKAALLYEVAAVFIPILKPFQRPK